MIYNPLTYFTLANRLSKAAYEKVKLKKADFSEADLLAGDRLTRADRLYILVLIMALSVVITVLTIGTDIPLGSFIQTLIVIFLLWGLSGFVIRAFYFLSGQRLSTMQARTTTNVFWLMNLCLSALLCVFEIGMWAVANSPLSDWASLGGYVSTVGLFSYYMRARFDVKQFKTLIALLFYPLVIGALFGFWLAMSWDNTHGVSSASRNTMQDIYQSLREEKKEAASDAVEQLCRQNIQQPATIVTIANEFVKTAVRQKSELHAYDDALASLGVADHLMACLQVENPEGYAKQDPELHLAIHERKASLLSALGKHAEAKAVYEMLRNRPCPATMTCDAAFKAAQIDDVAIETLHLSQAEEAVALYKEAETLLGNAQFSEKDRYPLYNGLANGYRMLGQFDEARRYVERAMAVDPNHAVMTAQAVDSAAEIELDAKQYDKALALNEKSLGYNIGPNKIYRETMKARILRAMNRRDEACKVLTPALLRVAKAQPDEDIQKAQTLYRELACQSGTAVH